MPSAGSQRNYTIMMFVLCSLLHPTVHARTDRDAMQSRSLLPLCFTENQGQQDPDVLFTALGHGGQLSIHKTGLTLQLDFQSDQNLSVRFENTNPQLEINGNNTLPGRTHYLKGNDPSQWHRELPNFQQVEVHELYPGIDLLYYGNMDQLEYDLVVSTGANPNLIQMVCSETDGQAAELAINEQGDLVITTAQGNLIKRKPISYQWIQEKKHEVLSSYEILDPQAGVVGFSVDHYDPAYPLVIDPILVYSTYLGGSNGDWLFGMACDQNGDLYLSGNLNSTHFPTTEGALAERSYGSIDTIALKFHGLTHELIYATYIGGSDIDYGGNIAVDAEGCAYLTGNTDSRDLPVTPNAYDPTYNGNSPDGYHDEIFVIKLNADGNDVVYGTYLGGSRGENPCGIALDQAGCAYIVGHTSSDDFPTTPGAYNRSFQGGGNPDYLQGDIVLVKLNAEGSDLVYSTFLGGSEPDYPLDLMVDDQNCVTVVGNTTSQDFPTWGDHVDVQYHGDGDGIVTRFNASGSQLLYSSFIGGTGSDSCSDIVSGQENRLYIVGDTSSTDFPITSDAYSTVYKGGATDGFVLKMNAEDAAIEACSYLGGNQEDARLRVSCDAERVVIVGGTASEDFPTTSNAFDLTYNGPTSGASAFEGDVFVTEMSLNLDTISFSTFVGGGQGDTCGDACLDPTGTICVVGITNSSRLPVSNDAYDTSYNRNTDGFFFKLVSNPYVDGGPVHNLSTDQYYRSIQHAILEAQQGDEIVIAPGIYQESLRITDLDLQLRSIDPNDPFYIGGTIIQSDYRSPILNLSHNSSSCLLTGLTLRAGLVGITGTDTDVTLRNCRIMDNEMHGMELFEGSDPHLNHCLITSNEQSGITMHEYTHRTTIYCQPVIENCVIVQNGQTAWEGGEPTIIDSIVQN